MLARWRRAMVRIRRPAAPQQPKPKKNSCRPTTSEFITEFSDRSSSENEHENDPLRPQGSEAPPLPRDQGFVQRMMTEKNRWVQRMLVAIRIAQPPKDTYLTQKRLDYAQAVNELLRARERIEQYTDSLLQLCEAICIFAGNSSNVRNSMHDHAPSFLLLADNLKDKAHEYRDEVYEKVLQRIDDHIIELEGVRLCLQDLANLQLDVDYAKRELTVAQQKGDVNRIADRKRAVQTALMHRKRANDEISHVLCKFDAKQTTAIDNAMNEFAAINKVFFRYGASILRVPKQPDASPLSSSSSFPSRKDTKQHNAIYH